MFFVRCGSWSKIEYENASSHTKQSARNKKGEEKSQDSCFRGTRREKTPRPHLTSLYVIVAVALFFSPLQKRRKRATHSSAISCASIPPFFRNPRHSQTAWWLFLSTSRGTRRTHRAAIGTTHKGRQNVDPKLTSTSDAPHHVLVLLEIGSTTSGRTRTQFRNTCRLLFQESTGEFGSRQGWFLRFGRTTSRTRRRDLNLIGQTNFGFLPTAVQTLLVLGGFALHLAAFFIFSHIETCIFLDT
mmetsp:Transcript_32956/g.75915  ORF Transcript_32956/g.75915 Transcript_32956/m.75915 type:complete len:243 (-) Transcript_32956:581-1309(-)